MMTRMRMRGMMMVERASLDEPSRPHILHNLSASSPIHLRTYSWLMNLELTPSTSTSADLSFICCVFCSDLLSFVLANRNIHNLLPREPPTARKWNVHDVYEIVRSSLCVGKCKESCGMDGWGTTFFLS